jgi:osmoprotectant transport system substrate-binding protein
LIAFITNSVTMTPTATARSGSITIGSADFSESQLVATIYSQALQDAGVDVTERLNIGTREVYIAAVQDGSIDLVPDYAGSLLKHLNADSESATTEEVLAELETALPEDLVMGEASDAQNKGVIVVRSETADEFDLSSVADLAEYNDQFSLGTNPEYMERWTGAIGMEELYGVKFADNAMLDAGGPLTMSAITSGQVDVAYLFSTDPGITANDLVVLEDEKAVFGTENILPILRSDVASDAVLEVLNAVSAALTTEHLIEMNTEAATGKALSDIASEWLAANLG